MIRRRVAQTLRIAITVTCGIAAILLCVLWAESYWYFDAACDHIGGTQGLCLFSLRGKTYVQYASRFSTPDPERGWYVGRDLLSEYESRIKERATLPEFGWSIEPAMSGVTLPHGFYITAFLSLAALPWVRWSKQFSLRTFLIATTLTAGGVALVVRYCISFEPY